MIENLPIYISAAFGLTTLVTLLLFYWTVNSSSDEAIRKKSLGITLALIVWLLFQAVVTLKGVYYIDTNALPPKLLLMGVLPTILLLIFVFVTEKGKAFVDSLPLKNITIIHTVRIPVELVLWGLCLYKTAPELMTFEGRNLDILAGITAPFIAYFGIVKQRLDKKIILAWNFICLGLLLNIVINAILSSPFPLQQFAFDQPNIAILYFPFSWLPVFVVPVVLFAHLVAIRQNLK